MNDSRTWGQIDALRERQIGRFDWDHQWLATSGKYQRCGRCNLLNDAAGMHTRCKGDTPEQAKSYFELFA